MFRYKYIFLLLLLLVTIVIGNKQQQQNIRLNKYKESSLCKNHPDLCEDQNDRRTTTPAVYDDDSEEDKDIDEEIDINNNNNDNNVYKKEKNIIANIIGHSKQVLIGLIMIATLYFNYKGWLKQDRDVKNSATLDKNNLNQDIQHIPSLMDIAIGDLRTLSTQSNFTLIELTLQDCLQLKDQYKITPSATDKQLLKQTKLLIDFYHQCIDIIDQYKLVTKGEEVDISLLLSNSLILLDKLENDSKFNDKFKDYIKDIKNYYKQLKQEEQVIDKLTDFINNSNNKDKDQQRQITSNEFNQVYQLLEDYKKSTNPQLVLLVLKTKDTTLELINNDKQQLLLVDEIKEEDVVDGEEDKEEKEDDEDEEKQENKLILIDQDEGEEEIKRSSKRSPTRSHSSTSLDTLIMMKKLKSLDEWKRHSWTTMENQRQHIERMMFDERQAKEKQRAEDERLQKKMADKRSQKNKENEDRKQQLREKIKAREQQALIEQSQTHFIALIKVCIAIVILTTSYRAITAVIEPFTTFYHFCMKLPTFSVSKGLVVDPRCTTNSILLSLFNLISIIVLLMASNLPHIIAIIISTVFPLISATLYGITPMVLIQRYRILTITTLCLLITWRLLLFNRSKSTQYQFDIIIISSTFILSLLS